MQSSEDRHPPADWADTRIGARLHFVSAALITLAVVSALLGIGAARAGNFVAFRYFLLFALTVALISALPASSRYRHSDLSSAVRTVDRNGISGTEIRYSVWPFAILVALAACLAVFCGMGAIEIFIYQDGGFPGGSVIAGVLAVVFASLLGTVAIGRIRRGGVTLSSRGIAQRGWSFESSLDWAAIAGAMPAFNGYPLILVIGYSNAVWARRNTTRFWRIDRLPPVPMIEFDCRQFDVDPHILYNYVRTYVDNPELRSELGTEAAIVRARQPHSAD